MEKGGGGGLLKGYSVTTIKHKRRYEELPENGVAYLSWCRAATCLCHIVSLSLFFTVSLSLCLLLYASYCLLSQSFSDTSPSLQIEQPRKEERQVYLVCISVYLSVRLVGVALNRYC